MWSHESVQWLHTLLKVVEKQQEGRDFGVTFLMCNQPNVAFAPNVNREQVDSIHHNYRKWSKAKECSDGIKSVEIKLRGKKHTKM